MFSYYMELTSKPYYTLSYGERMYIDLFPYIILAIILVIILVVTFISSCINKKR